MECAQVLACVLRPFASRTPRGLSVSGWLGEETMIVVISNYADSRKKKKRERDYLLYLLDILDLRDL
jgi:hypothetical protein